MGQGLDQVDDIRAMHGCRLDLFREELGRRNLDAFVVPHSDEHLSEYVPEHARRLAWLTGFRGSAGMALVTAKRAVLFVDGRYTLQAQAQVDGDVWEFERLGDAAIFDWLAASVSRGERIGVDPWLHGIKVLEGLRGIVEARGACLVEEDGNPIDAVWADQPRKGGAAIWVHDIAYAGVAVPCKLARIAADLRKTGVDAAVLVALDSIAWTFNIRGRDVPRTPVPLANAIVHRDETAELFTCPDAVGAEVRDHLGTGVRLYAYEDIASRLGQLQPGVFAVDPERTPAALLTIIRKAGGTVVEQRDPVLLAKAVKNSAEIEGHRRAQLRDGVALCRFLHWLSQEWTDGISEISAARQLERLRREEEAFRDLAFDTISAAGPNGAIIHYRPTSETDRTLEAGTLYLCDSGAQYVDGTTDVTRTIAVGSPSDEMRQRFTETLRGHIRLATAVFPEGTYGGQLDALARLDLWSSGNDYPYGTGHGVGSFLCGHEGPQRIAHKGYVTEPLLPGMILSNEPGYYKAGAFGLRIENLMLVERRAVAHAPTPMLGFETLTLAPIDRDLIVVEMLTPEDIRWLDDYHKQVAARIGPLVDETVRKWIGQKCRPLATANHG